MELYSVIKNDAPENVLFRKFAGEDFRTGSQLIVAENEEALFVKDGIIQEVFTGGRYKLETNNYPFIDRLRSLFSGGVNAFHCKVFYVNKAHILELFWGTDTPIQMRDPVYGILTSIQARGSYSIQVADSKKFVLKFVANNTEYVDAEKFSDSFRTVFMQKVKSLIPKAVRESGNEILGICERQEEFAEMLKPALDATMEEYGIRLVNFYIGALDIPQNEPSRVTLEKAHANRAELNILGQNWQQVQTRDIMMAATKNHGVPGVAAGLGFGAAAGLAMNAMTSPALNPQVPSPAPAAAAGGIVCPSCGASVAAGAKFCSECGTKMEMKKSFCTNCGAEMTTGAKFCPECGTKK